MTRSSPPRPRIFYFAQLVNDPRQRRIESAAGRNKVLGIIGALRSAGARAFVVTTAGTLAPTLRRPIRVVRRGGVPFVEVLSYGGGAMRRLTSAVFLLWFALVVLPRGGRALLYNPMPDYLPMAAWLRLRGTPAVIDMEDAPRSDDRTALGRLTAVSWRLLRPLCAARHVVASRLLARHLGLVDALAVYGVDTAFTSTVRRDRRFAEGGLRVLYGGTIEHALGAELFRDGVHALAARPLAMPVEIFVTGRFAPGLFDDLKAAYGAGHGMLRVTVADDLDTAAYRALLATIDVGLSLRLPGTSLSEMTFPSKVVEFTSLGMLLVSTNVSDVPAIFDAGTAVLLARAEPAALADALQGIAADATVFGDRARQGQTRAEAQFGERKVGEALLDFLCRPRDHAARVSA